MLRPNYPLETPRLRVRPFTSEDLDDLFAIQSRADVARYLLWEPRELAEVRRVLDQKRRQSVLNDEGDALTLAVVWRETSTVVGEVNLGWRSRQHRQGEIGFVFNPDYHGKGLATEAAEVMLRLAFADLGLHRVIGRCDARNLPSARVMERLGMRCEAHFVHNEIFKDQWGEELVYAILAEEWHSRQPAALSRCGCRRRSGPGADERA